MRIIRRTDDQHHSQTSQGHNLVKTPAINTASHSSTSTEMSSSSNPQALRRPRHDKAQPFRLSGNAGHLFTDTNGAPQNDYSLLFPSCVPQSGQKPHPGNLQRLGTATSRMPSRRTAGTILWSWSKDSYSYPCLTNRISKKLVKFIGRKTDNLKRHE